MKLPISYRFANFNCTTLTLLVVFSLTLSLPVYARGDPVPGDYRLQNGKVDRGTYIGWRIYHTTCYGCHGIDAIGSDVAPNLIERVKMMTPRAFATKVLTSYRIGPKPGATADEDRTAAMSALIDRAMRRDRKAHGQLVMPAWENSTSVNPHVLDLYAYLLARGDGLGPGRPAVIGGKR